MQSRITAWSLSSFLVPFLLLPGRQQGHWAKPQVRVEWQKAELALGALLEEGKASRPLHQAGG